MYIFCLYILILFNVWYFFCSKSEKMTTESALPLPRLPVPDIRAEVAFQHSQKQNQRLQEYRLRPPKLRLANRSHLSACMSNTAHAISFRSESDGNCNALPELDANALSGSYDRSMNETYFEQCFTRLAKIGEGSFGEVFKVRSKEDGRMYAIKMSKELYRSEHYRQERLEEVRRYEQFSGHANFVQFYRAWEQNDRLYMQMELCRESLDRYLVRRRHIPEETIWNILLDLLLALKNLHDRNLIHLDIKLDNVLIGDDDSCKLADFGLVIDVDRVSMKMYILTLLIVSRFITVYKMSCLFFCLGKPPSSNRRRLSLYGT